MENINVQRIVDEIMAKLSQENSMYLNNMPNRLESASGNCGANAGHCSAYDYQDRGAYTPVSKGPACNPSNFTAEKPSAYDFQNKVNNATYESTRFNSSVESRGSSYGACKASAYDFQNK